MNPGCSVLLIRSLSVSSLYPQLQVRSGQPGTSPHPNSRLLFHCQGPGDLPLPPSTASLRITHPMLCAPVLRFPMPFSTLETSAPTFPISAEGAVLQLGAWLTASTRPRFPSRDACPAALSDSLPCSPVTGILPVLFACSSWRLVTSPLLSCLTCALRS